MRVQHDLCGKLIEAEDLLKHRAVCYAKDQPIGYTDPQTGAAMILLNGKSMPAPQPAPAPEIVMEAES